MNKPQITSSNSSFRKHFKDKQILRKNRLDAFIKAYVYCMHPVNENLLRKTADRLGIKVHTLLNRIGKVKGFLEQKEWDQMLESYLESAIPLYASDVERKRILRSRFNQFNEMYLVTDRIGNQFLSMSKTI